MKQRNVARRRMCLAQRRALRPLVVRPTYLGAFLVWERCSWWSNTVSAWVDVSTYGATVHDWLMGEYRDIFWVQSQPKLHEYSYSGISAHVDHAWNLIERLGHPDGFTRYDYVTLHTSFLGRHRFTEKKVERYFFG